MKLDQPGVMNSTANVPRLTPPLSFRLRSLSLRRTLSRLSPEYSHRSVLVPESFRGGCSFGAGRGQLSRAVDLNHDLDSERKQGPFNAECSESIVAPTFPVRT